MPRTMTSDSSRSLTKTRTALSCELTSTFQIRFRASWSCMNTVVAPRSNRTEPITTESASSPFHVRALEDQAGHGDHDQHQGRDGEQRVIGERRGELHRAI